MEAALLFRAPCSKQKPAPRCAASLPLGIAQIDGVSLHPELDRSAKDQEGREVDRQYFKRPHGRPRDGITNQNTSRFRSGHEGSNTDSYHFR